MKYDTKTTSYAFTAYITYIDDAERAQTVYPKPQIRFSQDLIQSSGGTLTWTAENGWGTF